LCGRRWAQAFVLLWLPGRLPVSTDRWWVAIWQEEPEHDGCDHSQRACGAAPCLESHTLDWRPVDGANHLCTLSVHVAMARKSVTDHPAVSVHRAFLGLCVGRSLALPIKVPLRWQGCVGPQVDTWRVESLRGLAVHDLGARPSHSDDVLDAVGASWDQSSGQAHQVAVMGRSDRLHHAARSAALLEYRWQRLCYIPGSGLLSPEGLMGRGEASPQHQAGSGPGAMLIGFGEDRDWTEPRRRITSSCAGCPSAEKIQVCSSTLLIPRMKRLVGSPLGTSCPGLVALFPRLVLHG